MDPTGQLRGKGGEGLDPPPPGQLRRCWNFAGSLCNFFPDITNFRLNYRGSIPTVGALGFIIPRKKAVC